ncbi:ABC transporter B family member 26, chloroplastic isoform X2 [Magnolia sinica]|uniref:ABC transporter B family member 26, chloroplastic isoform X2 n=1 Tax=Magnolia sinica TaxID=86752 RepID=UPI00265AD1F2|nr:ABC transporter B family member 26, chloroplastic isoform X2 [Magnolia sinica]
MGRIDMACLTLSPSFSFLSSFPHPLSVCSPCHQRPHHHHHLKLQLQLQLHLHQKCRRSSYIPLHCTRIASSSPIPNADGHRTGTEFVERLRTWIVLFLSFMPGGRWWRFPDHAPGEEEGAEKKMAVTVPFALHRMWQLVANDRWVIFAGFISLILAALSEISIPHFLAASIFSAQSAETLIFQRNTRILVLLCCASGICRYQKRAAKLTQEFTACANEVAQEAFSLMRTVRVYGTEKQECGRYMQWLKKLADISLRQSMAYGFWTLSFNTLYHATQVIAVLVGGIFIMGGHITVEKLTKFILYSEWLIYSTWFVGDNWSSLMQSIGASEKVFQLMDLLPSKQFLLQGLKLQTVIGHIEFVNVSFHYPSRITVPVLQHLNISLHPKEVVAIVGSNGSGKSTLVHLLLRLYEPTSGQIFIDGSPLEELDIKWLRENIGFVGQEPRLFRMDVSSNIRYGCTREISQEDVEWAAKQAYAHDFILSLPNGYETLVDNDLLSGGQKQRIAIARAILRDPAILIFDEATSALDADSEHYVKQVLHSVRHGSKEKRTVIVIAHRLSTIQAADRIVVMDSGRIVQMGDHKELLSKDGLYAQLTKRQTDGLLS